MEGEGEEETYCPSLDSASSPCRRWSVSVSPPVATRWKQLMGWLLEQLTERLVQELVEHLTGLLMEQLLQELIDELTQEMMEQH